jgi:phage gpG-like protein
VIEARIDSAPATRRLAQWRDAFHARLARAFADGAAALAGQVGAKLSGEVLAPRSGALRASIRAGMTQNANSIAVRVSGGGALPYARIQEYGGRIAVPDIRVVEAKALAFSYGGRFVFANRVRAHVIDIPERSFMRSALAEFAPVFAETIARLAGDA